MNGTLQLTILWIASASASRTLYGRTSANFLKIESEHDDKYFKNVICDLKPIKRYTKMFRVNVTAYRPISDLHLRLTNQRKTSANRYMPGLFNITFDVCDLVKPGSVNLALFKQMIDHFYSGHSEGILGNFRKCPFEGNIYFDELRNEEPTVGFSITEPGEYLTDLRFVSSSDKLYIALKISTLIKIAGFN